MGSPKRALLVTLVTLVTLACAPAVQAETLIDASGEQLYQRFCASCHGAKGAGDGPVAATFRSSVPDLSLLSRRRGGQFPTEQVRRIIDGREIKAPHGSREMPVWGQEFFTAQGADEKARAETTTLIERLITHLVTLQR